MFASNYTVEKKIEMVEEWKSSGLIIKEFCRKRELHQSIFSGWLNRFYPEREKRI